LYVESNIETLSCNHCYEKQ